MKGMVIIEGALDTLYFFYFSANGSTNPDVFEPKTFSIPRGIIPQNFQVIRIRRFVGVREQTNTLTDILLL